MINSPRRALHLLAALALTAAVSWPAAAQKTINALVWCDHTDEALLGEFTRKTGIKVNVKDYEGTGTALALLEQSRPGDWDVFVVDSTDVRRVVARGLLAELDPKDFPLGDIPDAVRLPEYHVIGGKMYAVPEKFGYNAIAFDKSKISVEKARDITTLWNPASKGSIAIYDYYLPIIGQVAVALGKKPQSLTEADLPAIKEKLEAMRANAALVGDVVTSQTALATGQVAVLAGGGEYAVAGLMAEKPNLDWVLPDVGGIRWQQAIRRVRRIGPEAGGDPVRAVHPLARGPGEARHLVVLLGDAGQPQGQAHAGAEEDAALGRAAEVPRQIPSLPFAERSVRQGDAGHVGGRAAAVAGSRSRRRP